LAARQGPGRARRDRGRRVGVAGGDPDPAPRPALEARRRAARDARRAAAERAHVRDFALDERGHRRRGDRAARDRRDDRAGPRPAEVPQVPDALPGPFTPPPQEAVSAELASLDPSPPAPTEERRRGRRWLAAAGAGIVVAGVAGAFALQGNGSPDTGSDNAA